ncbi:MAG TPA: hypothetical protein VLQ67_14745, partial [Arachnia sp.]|nr:hypothetical protein [Arachnia sp.]
AEAAGASAVSLGQQRDWGGYSGYFADPDGVRWEVAYNPGPLGVELMEAEQLERAPGRETSLTPLAEVPRNGPEAWSK